MKTGLPGVLSLLAICWVAASCDSGGTPETAAVALPRKLTSEQAGKLIRANMNESASRVSMDHLTDITSPDIWEQTGYQLFKNTEEASSRDTFAVSDGKAVQIGIGFGGYGVTSAVPYDVNKDGTTDIVYAYSFGSGIHRSVIAWLDLHDITEHIVPDKPAPTGFRQDDLILQAEEGNIAVYRIKGMGEGKVSSDVLRTYPTAKDIEDMTLVKEGELVWENSEFLNIPES
ncbi:hypothetical protein [Paenibacillus jilunlii]|uniref:Uncharacterized protein n=1 Tax=Paenibacillus jilunlii TaxID=682956 RepID=A0A1G9NNM6_9BACL|nr:hypothetical protein [Paenibacillus jilunlii]KWX77087.1 hypothetical protein AML91_08560 [Paenibacillus jilunlii]SDL87637.1 hypothetical protein SAMN05216191_106254 [Paenibacillus jilunlii]